MMELLAKKKIQRNRLNGAGAKGRIMWGTPLVCLESLETENISKGYAILLDDAEKFNLVKRLITETI